MIPLERVCKLSLTELTERRVCSTNKAMQKAWLYRCVVAVSLLGSFSSASASVVINEVLFNQSGSSDTGLEKIELYNSGDAAVLLGGWELYPDRAGYFVFPAGFSVSARAFVTVHLRLSGTNDAANLYYAGGSDNMGNSSGSVALFSESGHPADSIVDFVRYQKPGASESKTWESAASSKGLWTPGTFIDVSSLFVGSTIALVSDGRRGNASSWQVASDTIGEGNGSALPRREPFFAPVLPLTSAVAPSRTPAEATKPASPGPSPEVVSFPRSDEKEVLSEDTLAAIRPIGSAWYFIGALFVSLLGAGVFLFYRSRQPE